MKFNITMTEKDFIEFNIAHLKISKVGNRITKLMWLISIMVVAVGGVVFFTTAKSNGTPVFIPIVLTSFVAIAMLIYMLFFNSKVTKRSVLKTIKAQKKDGKLPFSENSVVEFTDDEVIEETQMSVSRVKYENLERICICDTAIYLYINSQQAIILPFNQLGDEKDNVISFIKNKVNIK